MNNEFVSGDTGSALVMTCLDNVTNLPLNLTGASVSIKWKNSVNVLVTRAGTIVNPLTGVVRYQFASGELFSPSMSIEVEVTDGGGNVISNLDLIKIAVREQLA
jgi:hypothetical protein